MTEPRFIDCRCGHPREAHQAEHDGMCVLAGCQCLEYRPKVAPVSASPLPSRPVLGVPTPNAVRPGPTAEQIIAAGKRSEHKRTAALAEKIANHLATLATALRTERQEAEERRKRTAEQDAVRTEVERLSRELAAARAKLARHACTRDGCGRGFDSAQGRALHERRAHDGFNPGAQKAG